MLRVTWIAPIIPELPVLLWLNEMSRIQQLEGVQLLALTGEDLSREDVGRTLQSPCDLLIWSGHGAAGKLLLPGKQAVRPRWLTEAARKLMPRLVVLAACSSQERDAELKSLSDSLSRAGINTISFPARTTDDAAAKFAVALTWALASGSSLEAAYEVAVEEIADTETVAGVFLTPGLVDPGQERAATLLQASLDLIVTNLRILLGNRYAEVSEPTTRNQIVGSVPDSPVEMPPGRVSQGQIGTLRPRQEIK